MRLPALAAPARRERLLVAGGKPRTICWVKPGRRPDGFPPSPPPKEEGRRFGQISKPCSPRSAPVPGCTCRPLKTTTAESARP
jgi:hypothetical protein